eukprot:6753483-Heterocapsa_arctica.AAC.1
MLVSLMSFELLVSKIVSTFLLPKHSREPPLMSLRFEVADCSLASPNQIGATWSSAPLSHETQTPPSSPITPMSSSPSAM